MTAEEMQQSSMEFAELTVRLFMHEQAALELLPTPARRAELSNMVDGTLVATLRYHLVPSAEAAQMLRTLFLAVLTFCHCVLDHQPIDTPAGVGLQHALALLMSTVNDEERASVAGMRESFKETL